MSYAPTFDNRVVMKPPRHGGLSSDLQKGQQRDETRSSRTSHRAPAAIEDTQRDTEDAKKRQICKLPREVGIRSSSGTVQKASEKDHGQCDLHGNIYQRRAPAQDSIEDIPRSQGMTTQPAHTVANSVAEDLQALTSQQPRQILVHALAYVPAFLAYLPTSGSSSVGIVPQYDPQLEAALETRNQQIKLHHQKDLIGFKDGYKHTREQKNSDYIMQQNAADEKLNKVRHTTDMHQTSTLEDLNDLMTAINHTETVLDTNRKADAEAAKNARLKQEAVDRKMAHTRQAVERERWKQHEQRIKEEIRDHKADKRRAEKEQEAEVSRTRYEFMLRVVEGEQRDYTRRDQVQPLVMEVGTESDGEGGERYFMKHERAGAGAGVVGWGGGGRQQERIEGPQRSGFLTNGGHSNHFAGLGNLSGEMQRQVAAAIAENRKAKERKERKKKSGIRRTVH